MHGHSPVDNTVQDLTLSRPTSPEPPSTPAATPDGRSSLVLDFVRPRSQRIPRTRTRYRYRARCRRDGGGGTARRPHRRCSVLRESADRSRPLSAGSGRSSTTVRRPVRRRVRERGITPCAARRLGIGASRCSPRDASGRHTGRILQARSRRWLVDSEASAAAALHLLGRGSAERRAADGKLVAHRCLRLNPARLRRAVDYRHGTEYARRRPGLIATAGRRTGLAPIG